MSADVVVHVHGVTRQRVVWDVGFAWVVRQWVDHARSRSVCESEAIHQPQLGTVQRVRPA